MLHFEAKLTHLPKNIGWFFVLFFSVMKKKTGAAELGHSFGLCGDMLLHGGCHGKRQLAFCF